ncbi:MAG TPA: extensin family protein [Hyphomicrobiales bacterium]|nr:extensin family protein [Hyphomicrobiales bacterium]
MRLAAMLLLLLLSGCGRVSLFDFAEKEYGWRTQAEKRCLAKGVVRANAYVRPMSPINGNGVCGIGQPFKVNASLQGDVWLDPGATLDCTMTEALDRWLAEVVQPAAYRHFGVPVIGARNLGSYSCRTRNGSKGAKISEHAFGNAIDISAFMLAGGRWVAIKTGWRGAPAERNFWREIHSAACKRFFTVLGPDADSFHSDHLHLDLARHNRDGSYRHCK